MTAEYSFGTMKENTYALITGASGGIGLEFSKQLAAKGYNVICAARNLEKLNKVTADIKKEFGVKAEAVQSDLSKPGAGQELFKKASEIGDISILVNNAGVGLFGLSVEIKQEDVDSMLQLNVIGLTSLTNAFAVYFKEKKYGYILNIGSMAGNWPEPFFASYAASKSYVLNYSVALRAELKGTGVSVTCSQPGFVDTNFDANANISSDKYTRFSSKNSLSPAKVAKISLKMMFRKKAFGIPGAVNKIAAFFSGLMPKTVLAGVIKSSISRLVSGS